ncbi:hypothetical protein V1512DRAFT_259893 [Lipomyces arxii]|uniref:uncharacterized protein n=1 Tax=Lipomyces arxii TaxID=56418 RepID=UPI0034CE699B
MKSRLEMILSIYALIKPRIPLLSHRSHFTVRYSTFDKFYYEVTIATLNSEACVAIGYVAKPYPVSFRLPGWNRASLAIHSDDGRRYVADPFAGRDCLAPIAAGHTVGIGLDFDAGTVTVSRDGQYATGWSMYEHIETRDMDGFYKGQLDVYAAVGVYGTASVIVNFTPPFKYSVQ